MRCKAINQKSHFPEVIDKSAGKSMINKIVDKKKSWEVANEEIRLSVQRGD